MNARIVRHIRHGVVFEHGDEAPCVICRALEADYLGLPE